MYGLRPSGAPAAKVLVSLASFKQMEPKDLAGKPTRNSAGETQGPRILIRRRLLWEAKNFLPIDGSWFWTENHWV